jgi:hypothetical protein
VATKDVQINITLVQVKYIKFFHFSSDETMYIRW